MNLKMVVLSPICIYLVISPLVSLIPLGIPFPFASNSSTYPEKWLVRRPFGEEPPLSPRGSLCVVVLCRATNWVNKAISLDGREAN